MTYRLLEVGLRIGFGTRHGELEVERRMLKGEDKNTCEKHDMSVKPTSTGRE